MGLQNPRWPPKYSYFPLTRKVSIFLDDNNNKKKIKNDKIYHHTKIYTNLFINKKVT